MINYKDLNSCYHEELKYLYNKNNVKYKKNDPRRKMMDRCYDGFDNMISEYRKEAIDTLRVIKKQ